MNMNKETEKQTPQRRVSPATPTAGRGRPPLAGFVAATSSAPTSIQTRRPSVVPDVSDARPPKKELDIEACESRMEDEGAPPLPPPDEHKPRVPWSEAVIGSLRAGLGSTQTSSRE